MAGALSPDEHDVSIFDAMNQDLTFDDVRAHIQEVRPDYVITMDYLPVTGAIATATVPAALKVLSIAKEIDTHTVTIIAGPHPTFMYEEILEDPERSTDYVLRGEMEETLPELLSAIEAGDVATVRGIAYVGDAGIVATPIRPHIKDLDSLRPAWELLDWDTYHYNIEPWGRMA
ncbi:MAG: B12-binding domain-containing radical SAM protein, partial [Actinobacteria bacterium HGW-Actinobacteria-10]